jgi:hypothetical protein
MPERKLNPYAAPADAPDPSLSHTPRYSVTCACGSTYVVHASQAGSVIRCGCGAAIDVPRLSRLRAASGENPIPLNSVERIRAMIRSGELPKGDLCACCGRPANAVMFLRVQCEHTWVTGGAGASRWRWGLLFLGWIGTVLALAAKSPPREEFGRDVSVDLPLCVSSDCRPRLLGVRRQRKLKELLAAVPIYEELLNEFPRAIVSVMPSK